MNYPRFSRKETRQLAQEADEAGFIYTGDDTKGHAQFVHPSGVSLSLSETPAHGQIKRVRDTIASATTSTGPYPPTTATSSPQPAKSSDASNAKDSSSRPAPTSSGSPKRNSSAPAHTPTPSRTPTRHP